MGLAETVPYIHGGTMKVGTYHGYAMCLAALVCASCGTYKATLTNAQGEIRTCEVRGDNGSVTGQVPNKDFDACVANAIAAGYKESK